MSQDTSFTVDCTNNFRSVIVDELLSTLRGPDVGIAYVYCDYRAQESQTLSLITGNILRQLLAQQSNMPSSLYTLFEKNRREGYPATASELLKVLQEVCLGFAKCFILIDAIDEFDVTDANRTTDLLISLNDLAAKGVNIFITSRGLPTIPKVVLNASVITISAHEADIKAYVSQVLSEDANISELVDDQLRIEIISKLSNQAHGM